MATSSRRCNNAMDGHIISEGRKDSLMNYLYTNTSALMLDAYITCCNTDNLAEVWVDNKRSLLPTIKEINQGVTGYVVTEGDEPTANAVLSYDKSPHKVANSKSGAYWILMVPGSDTITAEASGYISETKLMSIPELNKLSHYMFKLRRDESILGMPRLAFIIISDESRQLNRIVCLGIVALGVLCYAKCQTKRNAQKNYWRDYAFILLGDGSSFFDDDEKKVEIFKRATNRAEIEKGTDMALQRPYFDEDNGSSSDEENDLEFVRLDDRDYEEKVLIVSQH